MSIYSYIVRYDSGFAPNPFYGFCTLATCKPTIRKNAKVGDWLFGTGSGERKIGRAGYLVYAMRVAEALTFDQYSNDPRFVQKKPFRTGSRKQSCGDNIYFRNKSPGPWSQLDSFHSHPDGTANSRHIGRDTKVNRVLVGTEFVYFGGVGPRVPAHLTSKKRHIVHTGIGCSRFDDTELAGSLESWLKSLEQGGYCGPPFEWLTLRSVGK